MYMAGFVLQIRVKTKFSWDKSEVNLSKTLKVSCAAQRCCLEHLVGEVIAESGADAEKLYPVGLDGALLVFKQLLRVSGMAIIDAN